MVEPEASARLKRLNQGRDQMKGMLGRGKFAFAAMCFFGAIANATAVNEWQEADIDGLLDAGQVVDADGYVSV